MTKEEEEMYKKDSEELWVEYLNYLYKELDGEKDEGKRASILLEIDVVTDQVLLSCQKY